MKKFLAALLVFLFCGVAHAQDMELIKKQLNRIFPNFKNFTVNKTPIPGVYEIIAENNTIFYIYPGEEVGYVFFGEIWSTAGKSITQEARDKLIVKAVEKIDLSKAVKIGNGKHQVIAFLDPNCPHCKKGYEYFSKRNDVTEYLLFAPIFGEDSKKKSAYVLCSNNPKKALDEIFFGNATEINVSQECIQKTEKILESNVDNLQSFGPVGVPLYIINKQIVHGANFVEIERIIGRQ